MANTKHISEVEKGDNLIINGCVIIATSDAYMTKTDNGKEWNFESGDDYYYISDFENGIVDIVERNSNAGCKVPVPYISVWDGGVEIETTAIVNIKTGEVSDITSVDVNGLDICERQYIVMQDEQVDVYEDERGYDYWADIENEILGEEDDMSITTKCVNGSLQEGDLVISTPDDEYACLIGRVTKINLLGTPEHDEETENETDDVHVNFMEFDYHKNRIKEIEEEFCGLYSEKKDFYNCGLDDVIMAPCCLIRISGIDDVLLNYLLKSRYNAACYCYGILSDSIEQIEPEITMVKNTMECLNQATSGFKITRIINGKTVDIELSDQELSNAFYWQERKYQINSIKEILANDTLMEAIISDYDDNREEYNMDWKEAALSAITKNITNTENNDVFE